MYTSVDGESTTSLNGGIMPTLQVALQAMRGEATSASVPRSLEPLEAAQQRAQLLDYAQRAQHYHQRLQAALLPTAAGRVLPFTSSTLQQSHPAAATVFGCGGLLSFIYAKLQQQDGTTSPTSPSHQQLHFLQAAAAAAAAAPATHHNEPKPSHSYIGLIAMAILSSKEHKLILSDIYQWILDHYAYFRYRGPGWRNSIRHNLSLNDCFVKAGRSANGKGHYWAIHPANVDDFERGDFRRRRAQRKVRRAMGLSVPDDDDSPGPSPSASSVVGLSPSYCSWTPGNSPPFFYARRRHALPGNWNRVTTAAAAVAAPTSGEYHVPPAHAGAQRLVHDRLHAGNEKPNAAAARHHQPRAKRRLFDMDSILAPDDQLTRANVAASLSRTLNTVCSHHQKDEQPISYTLLDDHSVDPEYKVNAL